MCNACTKITYRYALFIFSAELNSCYLSCNHWVEHEEPIITKYMKKNTHIMQTAVFTETWLRKQWQTQIARIWLVAQTYTNTCLCTNTDTQTFNIQPFALYVYTVQFVHMNSIGYSFVHSVDKNMPCLQSILSNWIWFKNSIWNGIRIEI